MCSMMPASALTVPARRRPGGEGRSVQADDPSKAADELSLGDGQGVGREIRKRRIAFSGGVARHEAAHRRRAVVGRTSRTRSPARRPRDHPGRPCHRTGWPRGRPLSRLRVCRAKREISRIGEPSGSVATRTREAYGCPVSRSSVARDALRPVRTSRRVSRQGRTGSQAASGPRAWQPAHSTCAYVSTGLRGCYYSGNNRAQSNRLATIYARRSHKARLRGYA